jgi:Fungalysin/Thermolysin Propeptide Motif
VGRISTAPLEQRNCPQHTPPIYQPAFVGRLLLGLPSLSPSHMRLSLKSSLVLLGLLGSATAHGHPITRRKTMGFGPVHPHAKFHTSPVSFAQASVFSSDPYEIARSFVTGLLQDQLSADNGFTLRKDSYTDKATGVTHVFFRQMVNGIEVADGDINVNVLGNTVISYGDSVSVVTTCTGGAYFTTPVLPWPCARRLPRG